MSRRDQITRSRQQALAATDRNDAASILILCARTDNGASPAGEPILVGPIGLAVTQPHQRVLLAGTVSGIVLEDDVELPEFFEFTVGFLLAEAMEYDPWSTYTSEPFEIGVPASLSHWSHTVDEATPSTSTWLEYRVPSYPDYWRWNHLVYVEGVGTTPPGARDAEPDFPAGTLFRIRRTDMYTPMTASFTFYTTEAGHPDGTVSSWSMEPYRQSGNVQFLYSGPGLGAGVLSHEWVVPTILSSNGRLARVAASTTVGMPWSSIYWALLLNGTPVFETDDFDGLSVDLSHVAIEPGDVLQVSAYAMGHVVTYLNVSVGVSAEGWVTPPGGSFLTTISDWY